MKGFFMLLAPLLLSSFMVRDEAKDQRDFRILIREESMLWINTYEVGARAISIKKHNRLEGKDTSVSLVLTEEQRHEIERLLAQLPWDALKENYIDPNAPQDMYQYQFTFEWEGRTKKVHLYQYKQEEIFALVQALNKMLETLPPEFKIGYTEGYFRNKR